MGRRVACEFNFNSHNFWANGSASLLIFLKYDASAGKFVGKVSRYSSFFPLYLAFRETHSGKVQNPPKIHPSAASFLLSTAQKVHSSQHHLVGIQNPVGVHVHFRRRPFFEGFPPAPITHLSNLTVEVKFSTS